MACELAWFASRANRSVVSKDSTIEMPTTWISSTITKEGSHAHEQSPASRPACAARLPRAAPAFRDQRCRGAGRDPAGAEQPDQWQERNFAGDGNPPLQGVRRQPGCMAQNANGL